MTKPFNFTALPVEVYEPDQLQFCAEELHRYAVKLVDMQRAGKAQPKMELSAGSQALLSLFPPNLQADSQAIDGLRNSLETALQKNPKVELILAAPASDSLTRELVSWFRSNINPAMLVSFHLRPSIGGGVIIRTPSRVYDFSFRKLLLADPAKLTRILKNV